MSTWSVRYCQYTLSTIFLFGAFLCLRHRNWWLVTTWWAYVHCCPRCSSPEDWKPWVKSFAGSAEEKCLWCFHLPVGCFHNNCLGVNSTNLDRDNEHFIPALCIEHCRRCRKYTYQTYRLTSEAWNGVLMLSAKSICLRCYPKHHRRSERK